MYSKWKVWLAAIIFTIIVFLVSLSWHLYQDHQVLLRRYNELQTSYNSCQTDNANIVIEKEILYKTVKDLTNTVNSQTIMVRTLTKKITELKYSPVIVRAIPCDQDVLSAFQSPKDNTKSRGF